MLKTFVSFLFLCFIHTNVSKFHRRYEKWWSESLNYLAQPGFFEVCGRVIHQSKADDTLQSCSLQCIRWCDSTQHHVSIRGWFHRSAAVWENFHEVSRVERFLGIYERKRWLLQFPKRLRWTTYSSALWGPFETEWKFVHDVSAQERILCGEHSCGQPKRPSKDVPQDWQRIHYRRNKQVQESNN